MQVINVPQLAWHMPKDLELVMPDDWQVQICPMDGHLRPGLSEEEILRAISRPIGTESLRKLARGKKEVVIVFAVYAGQWQQSYSAAVQDARKHFRTPPTSDKDIVISNSYAKANESMIGLASAIPLVNRTNSSWRGGNGLMRTGESKIN